MIVSETKHISQADLEEIRLQMVKFAVLQLKDLDLAEDVVQEALTSAVKNIRTFEGRAALKTWIFAILKNKIIDLIHSRNRMINVSEIYEEDAPNAFFNDKGHWDLNHFEPNEWSDIQSATYKEEFWIVFAACLNRLPAQQARIFMMREYLELDSEQICQECEISTSNLHVLLYRARLQLQACLSKNWFGGKK
ncbi:sigma-70 family RNA polymerase sigma factor [Histophilus somni]|uniref:sigma-70 family RNA polymerase sigma factor n=1 Tax=Histophilus somni TaxID=731 RepID=UPI0018EE12B1|nr:sigma-70 family RNA polymerase sigma factor [Histophilus somni]QQF90204.1 sigma-70 family RNA polymerase sigma factor [Histophilus somni]